MVTTKRRNVNNQKQMATKERNENKGNNCMKKHHNFIEKESKILITSIVFVSTS